MNGPPPAAARHTAPPPDVVQAMTKPANTPAALLALLDALEAELLDAPAEEIRSVMRETARSPDGACLEVSSLLEQSMIVSEDSLGSTIPLPLRDTLSIEKRAHH
jgi:hypothetical protein